VIQHQVTEVEVAALPKDLPEFLEVDLSNLETGGSVMLTEVKAPEGVEITQLALSEDAEIMVANAVHISESQGTGAAAAADAEALAEAEFDLGEGEEPVEGEEEDEATEGEAEPEGGSEE